MVHMTATDAHFGDTLRCGVAPPLPTFDMPLFTLALPPTTKKAKRFGKRHLAYHSVIPTGFEPVLPP